MTGGWRKSSRSQATPDSNCVEARVTTAGFQVRDSKLGGESPIFSLGKQEFVSLLRVAQR